MSYIYVQFIRINRLVFRYVVYVTGKFDYYSSKLIIGNHQEQILTVISILLCLSVDIFLIVIVYIHVGLSHL